MTHSSGSCCCALGLPGDTHIHTHSKAQTHFQTLPSIYPLCTQMTVIITCCWFLGSSQTLYGGSRTSPRGLTARIHVTHLERFLQKACADITLRIPFLSFWHLNILCANKTNDIPALFSELSFILNHKNGSFKFG